MVMYSKVCVPEYITYYRCMILCISFIIVDNSDSQVSRFTLDFEPQGIYRHAGEPYVETQQ